MWMVDENGNAKVEIDRLEAEMDSLTAHMPDALAEEAVEVDYHGIFCCVDGKMSCKESANFRLSNIKLNKITNLCKLVKSRA